MQQPSNTSLHHQAAVQRRRILCGVSASNQLIMPHAHIRGSKMLLVQHHTHTHTL